MYIDRVSIDPWAKLTMPSTPKIRVRPDRDERVDAAQQDAGGDGLRDQAGVAVADG